MPVLKNVSYHDIGKLVEAYGLACAERCGLEPKIRDSNGETRHPWEAWYCRGLEAICNDDLPALEEAVSNMYDIYYAAMDEDNGGKA